MLQESWVIANHILVSFHLAFVSSVLALPAHETSKSEVLCIIFFSPEALSDAILPDIKRQLARPRRARIQSPRSVENQARMGVLSSSCGALA